MLTCALRRPILARNSTDLSKKKGGVCLLTGVNTTPSHQCSRIHWCQTTNYWQCGRSFTMASTRRRMSFGKWQRENSRDWVIRACNKGFVGVSVKETLHHYRLHGKSVNSKAKRKQLIKELYRKHPLFHLLLEGNRWKRRL